MTSESPITANWLANRSCAECHLRQHCQGAVPGLGNGNQGTIMFVGEAPGENEDAGAMPFTGRAGVLLDCILQDLGLSRAQVWITNVVHCRPANNRTPNPQEARFCGDRWLAGEIELVRPGIIVAMGQVAVRYLTEDSRASVEHLHGIPQVRRVAHTNHAAILLPVYHPAAALHETANLRHVDSDFAVLKGLLMGERVERFQKVDAFPSPVYREAVDYGEAVELLSQPLFALDTETVRDSSGRDMLWSIQVSSQGGTGQFIGKEIVDQLPRDHLGRVSVIPETSRVLVHNYLYDAQFINIPNPLDTMVMAYLLGHPQGLKELAWRLCGMEMASYSDYTRPYRRHKALEYLTRLNGEFLGKPEPYPLTEWDNKQRELVTRRKKPPSLNQKVRRIIADAIDKDADPYERWGQIPGQEKAVAHTLFGQLQDANLSDIPRTEAVRYASRDPDATWRVGEALWPEIIAAGQQAVLMEMDLPILPPTLSMMDNGIGVDIPRFEALGDEFLSRMREKARECAELAGGVKFNPGSSDQVAAVVYGQMGYTPARYTETGKVSTDDKELKKVKHPVVDAIVGYRGLSKLRGTYALRLLEKSRPSEFPQPPGPPRIHAQYRTTSTDTGRMSSRDPNIMAMPVRSKDGKRIREGFVAAPGNVLAAFDLSQIEMRVMAHMCGSRSMIQLFLDGRDIHTETTAKIFGVSLEEAKNPAMRSPVKNLGFGVIYGIGPQGLYDGMIEAGIEGWPAGRCAELIHEYNTLYPEITRYRENQFTHARRFGWVADMFGRRRYIPEARCPLRSIRNEGYRYAGNTPIQAGAQGIIKLAMAQLWREGKGLPYPVWWLLQIHDELVFELPGEAVEDFREWVTPRMEGAVRLEVPVLTGFKQGVRWGEME